MQLYNFNILTRLFLLSNNCYSCFMSYSLRHGKSQQVFEYYLSIHAYHSYPKADPLYSFQKVWHCEVWHMEYVRCVLDNQTIQYISQCPYISYRCDLESVVYVEISL